MIGVRGMRYRLAQFHINVSRDLEKAKRLLYQVRDLECGFQSSGSSLVSRWIVLSLPPITAC
jgi:hypothetical protein